jgi:RNA methyltransferase, TrmH family
VPELKVIRSRDNAQVKRWAKLARDGRYRRAEGRAIIEGPHLLAALLDRGLKPVEVLATEEALAKREIAALLTKGQILPVPLAASAFNAIADTETPQGLAAEIEIPQAKPTQGDCIFLEGVQDAGNVGAILRSAAAFGVSTVVLDRACADPWSPKVLRSAMGGHFVLSIRQVVELADEVEAFPGEVLCTAPAGGVQLRDSKLLYPVGWLFGSEGMGVSPALQAKAKGRVTIPLAPTSESLNVAAAAAICLYEAWRRRTP